MAITLINSPLKISPVYNPNWWVFNSTNLAEDNFNYVFEVYQSTGTTLANTPLVRVRIPPDFTTSYGVYNPQKILQSFVSADFDPNITGCTPQDFIEYSMVLGEAYTYYTTFFTSGLVSIGGVLYNVFNTTTPHYYTLGQSVTVNTTGGTSSFSAFNGTWMVVSAITSTSFALSVPFNTAVGSGTTVLSTLSPTIFTGLSTTNRYYAHNAAIDTIDFIDYRAANYIQNTYYPQTGATSLFYTNAYNGYKVRRDNRAVFGYITEYPTGSSPTYSAVTRLSIVVERSNGTLDRYFIPLTCSEEVMWVGVGPWNIENAAGLTAVAPATLPIWQSDDVDYTVQLRNGTTQLSQEFLFKFYDFCGKWDNYELLFVDRKNSWLPFNFELVQRKNITNVRTNYKKGLGRYDGVNNWGYNSYDRGTTNVKNEINVRWTIVSNWMTEAQSLLFEELLTSPEVYWNYEGNGTFVAVNLTKLNEEIKNKKNTRLIQYTIEFELANNPMVQVGA